MMFGWHLSRFFDISAIAPMDRRRIAIINSIMGLEEFHVSFFVRISSRSFWEAIMGTRERIVFVFFLISFGDEDDT